MSNRITPERVLNGIEKTGLKPVRGKYKYYSDDGAVCGACALSLAALGDGVATIEEVENFNMHFLAGRLGLRGAYCSGFINGFDNTTHAIVDSDGWQDGAAARLAVEKKHGTIPIYF